ncbi:hypothetical protein [Vibrio galatheae]|uniref:hypothetical protein n=1 Tax=Vibrio galatheae TaxID=579748 RepID=UPI0012ED8D6C|nr:hypothetical protein [Vibrio galatheae]
MTHKTPMLNAPQQALNSNGNHFSQFAVVNRNQDALNLKTPSRITFWDKRFIKTQLSQTN